MYSAGRRRTRTTCAACRSPTPTARSRSPASSRPATPAAGRTSTSRSTPTRPASPTRPTPSPPRRSPCRRTSATSSTRRAGYEASVSNLSQVSLDDDNVFGDDGGASQLATVTGDVTRATPFPCRRRRHHDHPDRGLGPEWRTGRWRTGRWRTGRRSRRGRWHPAHRCTRRHPAERRHPTKPLAAADRHRLPARDRALDRPAL